MKHKNKKSAIKNNSKNYSEKVKVGEFKTPGEIIRDLINSGAVQELKKGGYLKDKNTYVTEDGKETRRGLWANVHLKKKREGKKEGGGALGIANTLAPLGNLITPGIGTALQGITGLIKTAEGQSSIDPVYTMNQQLEQGGEISGFKQYNAPSHEQGGQLVNIDGTPDMTNPAAEIEGTENSYSYNVLPDKAGSNYVFSDANQTSGMVRDIMSKYKNKNADKDLPTKAAMEMEIKNVENTNELINAAKSAVQDIMQMKYGGKTKYENGGGFDPLGIESPRGNVNIPLRDNTLPTIETRMPTSVESITDRNLMPDIQTNTKNNSFNLNVDLSKLGEGITRNLPGVLRTAGIVGSGIDAFQKPEQDELIMPDFTKSDERINAMNANLDQARQDVTGASNRASELNRGASSSYSQFRARELGNISNLQDQIGRIGMQEQQLRNQILGQQGQYEMNKAMTERGIRQENQIANLQNQARSQDIKRQFMSDIVHEADRLSTAKDVRNISAAKIEEGMALLSMIAPDMDVNRNMVENFIKVSKGQMKPEELSDQELIVFTRLNG